MSADGASDRFAFRLRFLQTMFTHMDPTVLEELFRNSAGTLECLELDQNPAKETLQSLCKSFPHVAGTIHTLRISDAYLLLVPGLEGCTALKRLELVDVVAASLITAIFKILPSPLDDLYMETLRDSSSPGALDHILQAFHVPSLSRLKRLHVEQDTIADMAESMRLILKVRNIAVLAVSDFLSVHVPQ